MNQGSYFYYDIFSHIESPTNNYYNQVITKKYELFPEKPQMMVYKDGELHKKENRQPLFYPVKILSSPPGFERINCDNVKAQTKQLTNSSFFNFDTSSDVYLEKPISPNKKTRKTRNKYKPC